MYVLNQIRMLDIPVGNWDVGGFVSASHLLITVKSGQARLIANGERHFLEEGAVFLFPPEDRLQVEPDTRSRCRLLVVEFDHLEELEPWGNERRYGKQCSGFPVYGRLPAKSSPGLKAQVRLLWEVRSPQGGVRGNREAVLFQQLMGSLLELPEQEGGAQSQSGIERSAVYMEENCGEELDRDKLAAIAGLSPWYYSHLFKQSKGISPMAYLEDIRMRRAKELLTQSGATVQEAAYRCGFADESYFRRRFKLSVGVTPAAFVRQREERVAVMSYSFTSHLVALGVVPWAAPVRGEEQPHLKGHYALIRTHLARTRGESGWMARRVWDSNVQLLGQAHPSLILSDDILRYEQYGGSLERIAPCERIAWSAMDWRGHLRKIAALLHKEQSAELWLEQYGEHTARKASMLRGFADGGSVLLLRITGRRMSVFGSRNAGVVLYDDLQLPCPYDWRAIPVEETVELPFIQNCQPAAILLVVDANPAAESYMLELERRPVWQELDAVRSNRVYRLKESPWLEYSPLAHAAMVESLPALAAQYSS